MWKQVQILQDQMMLIDYFVIKVDEDWLVLLEIRMENHLNNYYSYQVFVKLINKKDLMKYMMNLDDQDD
jgi:hypothetical protein